MVYFSYCYKHSLTGHGEKTTKECDLTPKEKFLLDCGKFWVELSVSISRVLISLWLSFHIERLTYAHKLEYITQKRQFMKRTHKWMKVLLLILSIGKNSRSKSYDIWVNYICSEIENRIFRGRWMNKFFLVYHTVIMIII